MDKRYCYLHNVLPDKIKKLNLPYEYIEEIRIKKNYPLVYYTDCDEFISDIKINEEDILYILNWITENSLYAYLDDIVNGFITIEGGHRVGISGTAVTENGRIINIKDINYMNIRMGKEKIGISNNIIKYIYPDNYIKNTLIISPPGVGKTTLIRDISRNLSDVYKKRVTVIDERYEIGATYKGEEQNKVGQRTAVLSGYSKRDGIMHSIRSLSPDVIICDEIGDENDVLYIKSAVNKGIKIVATIHGYSETDIINKKEYKELFDFFEVIVILDKNSKDRIKKIMDSDFNVL